MMVFPANWPTTNLWMPTMSRLAIAALLGFVGWSMTAAADPQPHVVIVLSDDLGYGDLGCYGHPVIRTPHLDQMAREGIRLTSCYSAPPVCSPSRVGLLTGRNPNRAGVFDWIPQADQVTARDDSRHMVHLRRGEVTPPAL